MVDEVIVLSGFLVVAIKRFMMPSMSSERTINEYLKSGMWPQGINIYVYGRRGCWSIAVAIPERSGFCVMLSLSDSAL